ncbi:fumarylacetoacetate hydrolase family protein [Paraburkholderia sp. J63]|uniref:fumarylacetoacetate hydrolase family protein n=1 Tax=Paraburkholderia sp. J63 TaxID=2805434 RepID=UPI002ABE0686|nr:fumarylacetoacetate hydrolase family protein [Paraburkholderia sp. J63]
MKIVNFEYGDYTGWGMVDAGAVLPVPNARNAADVVALANSATKEQGIGMDKVRWLAPVTPDAKILCAGFNYRSHVKEMARDMPDHPSIFVRFPDSFVGHEQGVVRPRASTSFDYEAEIAVVIGKEAWRVDASQALDHVLGYTCMAENSARDFQRHNTQATPGKNFERSGAIGPWIATADEFRDPNQMTIIGRLNGDQVQRGSSADLICSVAGLVAYISSFTRLRPGDIIATGTPEGVGMTRTPAVWLRGGDTFEVEIEGLGTLRNPVIEEEIR